MAEVLSDFPVGPLDNYREKASFDWKKLKLFLYTEDELRAMHNIYEELKGYPEFQPITKPLTFDEERYLAFRQSAILRANEKKLLDPKYSKLMIFAPDARMKTGLTVSLFRRVIADSSSKRHKHFLKELEEGKIIGCFGLTEVGHGSNVKGMRTRATYDKENKQFIIHTPDFQAAKCWIGGLGLTATHILLYAQLYIESKCYGLHTFVVPIRDPQTYLPYSGITVGDMGEKIGLHGVDNGFILFNNYRIPRENLLNKTGDVTEDGKYVTPFIDDNKRFGASLIALSASRVGVITDNEFYGSNALTIAVRYAAVRRQFGTESDEIPILEYQTHQYRLIPHVAAVYILKVFLRNLSTIFNEYAQNSMSKELELLGAELHVLTSAAKPVSGWMIRDAIQSCREACAGHGYLKASGLGIIKNNQDAAQTFEGENWVLIQQTSNFLTKLWSTIVKGGKISSPLKSIDFLSKAINILRSEKFLLSTIDELCRPESIINIYQWLVSYLLQETYHRQFGLTEIGANKTAAKNDTQVFYARKLGIAYIEHFFLQEFLDKISQCPDVSLKPVLFNMLSLYGLYSLEKFLSILYQGGYASGEKPAVLIQDGIIELCGKLKNEAVALVDVVGSPDFILNSAIGASDGQVYQRLEQSFLSSPYGLRRPDWWNEMVNWKDVVTQSKSKL